MFPFPLCTIRIRAYFFALLLNTSPLDDNGSWKFNPYGSYLKLFYHTPSYYLKYKDLNQAIDNLIKLSSKHILISVPSKGTPNCDIDPTHIIKESKEWWIKQFTDKGLKLIETANHFLSKEQLLKLEK